MERSTIRRYHAAVAELESCIGRESRNYMDARVRKNAFFLQRTQHLFDALGNPERDIRSIHIAGTSGKGSTSTMIHRMLRAAGWNVGLYVSPHVTTSIERIRVNDQLIAPSQFSSLVRTVLPMVKGIEKNNPTMVPSYMEIFFAIAMLAFRARGCTWAVIEAGCGGRFDKTNILSNVLYGIITNISREHIGVLGRNCREIAWHKAGIIKKGMVVFSGETDPRIRKIFQNEATQKHATLHFVPSSPVPVAMAGSHQQENAALVTALAQELGIAKTYCDKALTTTHLPARIEMMQRHPRVILDGAHAPAKIRALTTTLPEFHPWRTCRVIIGIKEGKELRNMLLPLMRIADEIMCTTFSLPGFHGISPKRIATTLRRFGFSKPIFCDEHARSALTTMLGRAKRDDLVVITGSLYLAGILRQHWVSEEWILQHRRATRSPITI